MKNNTYNNIIKIRDMKKLFVILFPFIASAQIDNAAVQVEFAKLINLYRAENGVGPLKTNVDAQKAALIQSDYLASTLRAEGTQVKATCGHNHPEFNAPQDRLAEVNPELAEEYGVGECAAIQLDPDIATMTSKEIALVFFNQWKASPPHNAAMLDGDYTHFGISVSTNSKTKVIDDGYFTHDITYVIHASALVLLMPY